MGSLAGASASVLPPGVPAGAQGTLNQIASAHLGEGEGVQGDQLGASLTLSLPGPLG